MLPRLAPLVPRSPALPVRAERASLRSLIPSFASPSGRAELLTIVVVLVGLGLRARGYLFDVHGLWYDEAAWAVSLMTEPLSTLLIRPPGFMAATRALATLLGPSEGVLRSLPWFAGVGSVLISVPLARRLYPSAAARLVFVAILALHPGIIDLAKEFKPYSVSLFLHLALLDAVLRYTQTRSPRTLVISLLLANASIFFAQDAIFAMPSVFLVLAATVYRYERAHLPSVIFAATTIVLAVGAQDWFIWRHIAATESSYWGSKYGVFWSHESGESFAAWWLARYVSVASMPGMRHDLWSIPGLEAQAVARLDGWLWCAVHVAGLARWGVKRRYDLLVLTLLPIAVHFVFNGLGYWPGGAFRTNLFLLAYTAAIAGAAAEWLPVLPWSGAALLPASVLVVLPFALFDEKWNARKETFASDNDFPLVVRRLAKFLAHDPPHSPLKLHLRRDKCTLFTYYTTLHPTLSETPGRSLADNLVWSCDQARPLHRSVELELQRNNQRFWVLGEPSDEPDLRHRFPELKTRARYVVGTNYLAELVAPER